MTLERAFTLAAGSLVLFFAADLAVAQIPAAPGSPPRDEEPGRAREVVPLPPIPEHMAVPTPTEGEAVMPPTPEATVAPTPLAKPPARKQRKTGTPKPARGVEKL